MISYSVTNSYLGDKGWSFNLPEEGATSDDVNGKQFLREVYLMCDPNYSSNITVPVLFDKVAKKIVNNESSEIIRMLNSEFNEFCETDEQKKVFYSLILIFLILLFTLTVLTFFFFVLFTVGSLPKRFEIEN